MSANEDELPEVYGEQEMVDSAWEDFEKIIGSLPDEPLDSYDGFSDASELINYVQNELEFGEDDLDRVLYEFENEKCPYCEEENLQALTGDLESEQVDPTMSTGVSQGRTESFREDKDEKVEATFMAYCRNHGEAWFEYSESWFEED